MTDKVSISVLLDQETLDKVIDLQKKKGIFSRSKMLRIIIEKGLLVSDEKAG